MVPLSTARLRIHWVTCRAAGRGPVRHGKVQDPSALTSVENGIRRLLRQRHRLPSDAEDDFVLRNLAEVQESREAASRVLSRWLSAVASVSLIVGGISIMNIMLVSVTERTREIGLRLAIGARASDIRAQFLAEAVVLSLVGALLGVMIGMGAAATIAVSQGLPVLVRPGSLLIAAGFSVAIGVLFGLYPALKAGRLPPAEALRAE